MRKWNGIAAALAIALILPAQADDLSERAAASQAAIKGFASTLQGELVAAMQKGGPVEAISVCNQRAPEIAA